jgi:hypothetical protein
MSKKATLEWYEDEAVEITPNADGSVTFVFDEPGNDPKTGERLTSSTTIRSLLCG